MATIPVPPLEIEVQRLGTTLSLEVRGEIDVATTPELRRHVSRGLSERPATVVVDLRHVDFIDSSGIHLLLDVRKEAQARAAALVVLRPEGAAANRVFELCGIDELLPRSEQPRFVTEWAR